MKQSKLFVAGAAAMLLPFAAAIAQSPPPDPSQAPTSEPAAPEQSRGATFESLDANGDGKISKDEAEANAGVKARFSSYDLNGDGFIERAEVNKANAPAPSPTPQQ